MVGRADRGSAGATQDGVSVRRASSRSRHRESARQRRTPRPRVHSPRRKTLLFAKVAGRCPSWHRPTVRSTDGRCGSPPRRRLSLKVHRRSASPRDRGGLGSLTMPRGPVPSLAEHPIGIQEMSDSPRVRTVAVSVIRADRPGFVGGVRPNSEQVRGGIGKDRWCGCLPDVVIPGRDHHAIVQRLSDGPSVCAVSGRHVLPTRQERPVIGRRPGVPAAA
jgi:hypothetical protein